MSDGTITPPHSGQEVNLAAIARRLVSNARRGVLCTLIPEDGYPYGSLVNLLPLPDGDVAMFLSRLAEHQHYLEADNRASVAITPHMFDEHALARPRVTLMGRAERMGDRTELVQAYAELHPDAASYIDFPDFQFYRLRVERVRLIAGFGQMGWISGTAYRTAS